MDVGEIAALAGTGVAVVGAAIAWRQARIAQRTALTAERQAAAAEEAVGLMREQLDDEKRARVEAAGPNFEQVTYRRRNIGNQLYAGIVAVSSRTRFPADWAMWRAQAGLALQWDIAARDACRADSSRRRG